MTSGPIPPYTNPPIESQYYQPSRFQISDITLGQTTIITATEDLNYVVGQQVRLIIPQGYGCSQITGLSAYVISLPLSNQVEISIDSTYFDPFSLVSLPQLPQILAIGDVGNGAINTSNLNNSTFIPGSFINISPE